MNNKLILDLTVQLTQALDQNYDVVNMDTVLAVISALEGATITKEQLETTRLAKHINQLRRRNKSNILAIRAKNLLKQWREMVGITSQAQSEGPSSAPQQTQASQQQTPKPLLSSASQQQPASPYSSQLLGENFDNSLSSIGGGVEFSRTSIGGSVNTGSANFIFNKKSATGTIGEGTGAIISSRSNGALTDSQMRLMKSSNRSMTNHNSSSLPVTIPKVKHPTSFKNLITGFNNNSNGPKQSQSPALSPLSKAIPASSVIGGDAEGGKSDTTTATYIIDDDNIQSQPPASNTGVAPTVASSPHTQKSTKRKERDSPVVMTFIEQSNSPIAFENISHEPGRASQTTRNNKINQIVTSTIDLHDSNSNSNFTNALCEVTEIVDIGNSARSGLSSNSKRSGRKDKKRPTDRINLITDSGNFQPTIDESSRIAFPISGIQEYLSLSNSSMSLFPSQKAAGSGEADRYTTIVGSNDDNQPLNSSTDRNSEVLDGDLTFAGKFKQNNGAGTIQVGTDSNYFPNGEQTILASSGDFQCGNMKVAMNNCRESVSTGGTASTSTFLQFSRNSSDSNSDSRTSQLDLIDVVNQDSQSMITVDDLRHQQQSSNEKNKSQKDVECVQEQQQPKYVKENSNALKQYSKEQQKSSVPLQKPINTSSQPSTPTSAINLTDANTVPPVQVEQKIPKKRGRKKGSKGVDSVLAQSAGLSSQFLMGPALGSNKKVKTTMELLADIQNRKLGSATSSPTLTNWFGTSRPASSCSELSLHSPRTSDACSTNATMSTAARSTPDKNISNNSVAVDELYESDSDTNTSEPSRDSVKISIRNATTKHSKPIRNEGEVNTCISTSSIEEKIKELMALLPPINVDNIDCVSEEEIPCTCSLEEIPPEVEVNLLETNDENGFDLLENAADNINIKDNFTRHEDEKPIISVNILPLPTQTNKQLQPKLWSSTAPHSHSAPVSAITSPNVPSTNQKPIKSIFDLDFDDDNDPLHSFVEAASKNKKEQDNSTVITENGKIVNIDKQLKHNTTAQVKNNNHSEINKTQNTLQTSAQFESDQQIPVQSLSQQLNQPQLDNIEATMPLLTNFPTYKVIEDPACQAKQRYETQTNQITQFHITAFHNCFIPNVNGNWDHSMPQNSCDDCQHLENKNIYVNVVPKYGCFVTERIPKDLSHVKFTKDFKPKLTKKSDKPPQPFLGVANIHGRHHFRLRYHQRLKKKSALKKKLKLNKTRAIPESKENIKHENTDQKPLSANSYSNIPEQCVTEPVEPIEVKKECDSNGLLTKEDDPPLTKDTSTCKENQSDAQDIKLENQHNDLDQYPSTVIYNNNNDMGTSNMDDDFSKNIESEPSNIKMPITNGYNPNLTNNNSIIHCTNQSSNKGDIFGGTIITLKTNNANSLNENIDGDIMAASRRSSSCSNSSLKQNQNSINMKLRKHRLEQQQRRKRKHIASITDVIEAHTDESEHRVPSLIKRFKLVNGEYASTKGLINNVPDNNCLYDDGDSDCHIQSENDMITEEEIDEDCDDQIIREGGDVDEDYDENPDDYDEDGDDEEDIEGPYGDFHEVVTRDMTSSTTGNNHIVLTIKKTPSKTNSPSSSSMSPAPVNVNMKISSNSLVQQSTNDVFLLEDNSNGFIESNHSESNCHRETSTKIEIGKNLEINPIDLIDKSDFVLVEPTNIAVYSFHQTKKDSEKDGSDDDNDERNRSTHINENDDHKDDDENNLPKLDSKDSKKITKTELFKSIQLTKKHIRRQELKKRLKTGIDEAQKLHRKLFFPYELHTSIGSKILDISSCSSDCTDTSDSEGSNVSDTETSSSTSSSSGIDGIKSLLLFKRRRKSKVTPKKKKAVRSAAGGGGGGGDDPSSSSSSSSSNSSSRSSGSYSTWTSSTSSSSSSSDDEDGKSKKLSAMKVEKQSEETKSSSINKEDTNNQGTTSTITTTATASTTTTTTSANLLPSENNYLLRSFNHIYVSTEERRRQQQLKQTMEYGGNTGVVNSGYITLSGDTSKQQQQQQTQSAKPLALSDNCNVYNRYYLCSNSNNSNYMTGGNMSINTNSSIAESSLGNVKTVTKSEPSEHSSVERTNNIDSNYRINSDSSIGSNNINNNSSISLVENLNQNQMENQNENKQETADANADPNANANADPNANANADPNANSDANEKEKENENANTALDLVAQEEYRTGLRKVDEDVDDEDGNNCARTQQFKEWHEVLQLRSYNDELLTVLPYVVIE